LFAEHAGSNGFTGSKAHKKLVAPPVNPQSPFFLGFIIPQSESILYIDLE